MQKIGKRSHWGLILCCFYSQSYRPWPEYASPSSSLLSGASYRNNGRNAMLSLQIKKYQRKRTLAASSMQCCPKWILKMTTLTTRMKIWVVKLGARWILVRSWIEMVNPIRRFRKLEIGETIRLNLKTTASIHFSTRHSTSSMYFWYLLVSHRSWRRRLISSKTLTTTPKYLKKRERRGRLSLVHLVTIWQSLSEDFVTSLPRKCKYRSKRTRRQRYRWSFLI